MKIAVVGAGITGLVAAHELSLVGHAVTIYERSDVPGGLASGFPLNGTHLEKTYHHLFRTDTDILSLIQELNIGDSFIWNKSSLGLWHEGTLYPFSTPLNLLRFGALPILDRIRLGCAILYLQKTNRWEMLERIPAHIWLKRWCGRRAYGVVWEPLLRGKFHNHFESVSMAWFWARVHVRANSKAPGERQEHLGYFHGGFHVLVQALVSALRDRGVAIHVSTGVERIRSSANSVQLTVNGTTAPYDRAICTVPSPVFAKMIQGDPHASSAYIQQLRSIQYLGAACLIFTTPQSLSPFYWNNINDPASPFLVFVQHTNLVPRSWYLDEHVYYAGTYVPNDHAFQTGTEQDVKDQFFQHLPRLFPHFDRRVVTQEFLWRFKNAQHVVDGNYRQKIPSPQTPLHGVYLANFSQIFPEDRGTNYAVREGRKIAHMVLQEKKT